MEIIAHREHGHYGKQYKIMSEDYTLGDTRWMQRVQRKYCICRTDLIDKYELSIRNYKPRSQIKCRKDPR